MNTHVDKTQDNKSQSVSNAKSQLQGRAESVFQFIDQRPEAVKQRKLQEMANDSPRSKQLALQEMADKSPHKAARQPRPAGKGSGVIQAQFEKIFNQEKVPVLYKEGLNEEEGRVYMARITAGDASVLKELDIYGRQSPDISDRIKDQAVECGLGKDKESDRVAIFVGTATETEWSVFLDAGLIALAHSHPMKDRNIQEEVLLSELFESNKSGLILPSMGDLWFSADEKVQVHTVYTPYKVVEKKNNNLIVDADPVEDAKMLLSFEIVGAEVVEKREDGINLYKGQLWAKWQGDTIHQWTIVSPKNTKTNQQYNERSPVLTEEGFESLKAPAKSSNNSEISFDSIMEDIEKSKKDKSLTSESELLKKEKSIDDFFTDFDDIDLGTGGLDLIKGDDFFKDENEGEGDNAGDELDELLSQLTAMAMVREGK